VEVPGPELRLIGRSAEVAQVLALIDDAETAGGVLVVRGDAGIGKSTLLRAATDHARERGHLLLGTSGTPAEQHLPFAALHHLLGPALSATTLLSVPHRAALNHVFGYASAGSPSPPFVIALAALELLAEHASDRPLLVAVDDAQWLDEASLDVLLFVARRLRTERIVLLLATRESETADGADPIVHDLVLKPLDDNAARLLLTVAHPTLSSGDIGRTLRMAAGNPLALLELPRVGESSTHDDAAPLPVALEHAFAGQLDHLTPPARAVLLAVAIQDGGTAADVWPVAETLTGTAVSADLLDGAATAGLITVRGDTVTFRHPLVRSAVRQAADPDLLRAAHRAWAQALISVDPDRYAWHRSWAVRGPDKQVADELEAAARRSRRRGAVAAAQRWLERAAALSIDRRGRQERLLAAADAAYELGRYPDVQRLLADVRREVLDRPTADRLAYMEGVFDDGAPGDRDGVRALVAGAVKARDTGDEDHALLLLSGAGRRCWWGDLGDVGQIVVDTAHSLSVPASDPRRLVIDAMAGTLAQGADVLARLPEWVVDPPADPVSAALLATAAFNLADFDRALVFADRAVDVLRAQGRLSTVAQVQVTRAWAALYVGRWNDAYVAADEAYRLAVETRQPVWAAHARLGQADLEGRRGRPERALELIVDAERLAVLTGRPTALGGVEYVRGIIELGRQRPHAAYEHLRRTMDPADRAFHSVERLWLADSFAEAAARSGHIDDAREVVAALGALISVVPSPGYHRAVGLARVLLADDPDLDEEIARARKAPGRTSSWFEARVDLAHGMSLRRRRRGVESRRPLSSALTIFKELGAAAWAQRAAAELAATGAIATPPERTLWSVLSPQELQIAQLAAQGLTNREIGERLFLSHRTVGSHLYRIFPKLDITSRNQLHLVLPEDGPLDRIG
jgi:DNA-binding CsgD family transcriptional regulator